ncbi:MAG TPA: putative zinc-binding metallopeptidase [Candidatus Binatia bacterium]
MNASSPTRRAACPVPQSQWENWTDEKLLDTRLCDLELKIEGTELEERIQQVYRELEARGICFRPYVWLSDDWFTPDGIPGIAVPFYMAHPRLARLELKEMFEVEGGTPEWCLRILRHETGHAIENAYLLRRRRKRQKLFGKSSQDYPEYYAPKPYSKSFVLHLDSWYAQSHPDEDFAETFAVWLNADSHWKERYAGWPALRKLDYMDFLMREIAGKALLVTTTKHLDPVSQLRKTLREHYRKKRKHYGLEHPNFYDRDLRRLFSNEKEFRTNATAASFLERIRREVRRKVAGWTGVYQYTIDQVLTDMIDRSRELKLHLVNSEDQTKLDFTVLLTVQTMNYLHSGRHRLAL